VIIEEETSYRLETTRNQRQGGCRRIPRRDERKTKENEIQENDKKCGLHGTGQSGTV
jgi:hypothetical protein